MLTLNVNGKRGAYELNLPTTLNEITKEYIDSVTNNVIVDANYTLIGVVYRERLSTLIIAANRKNKKSDIPVIPIFIKAGKNNSDLINSLEVRDKLIISASDIMLGHHVSSPRNTLTINNIISIIEGDPTAYQKLLNVKEDCYFIEFKLVPNCNIHGAYDDKRVVENDDKYVIKVEDNANSSSKIIV